MRVEVKNIYICYLSPTNSQFGRFKNNVARGRRRAIGNKESRNMAALMDSIYCDFGLRHNSIRLKEYYMSQAQLRINELHAALIQASVRPRFIPRS